MYLWNCASRHNSRLLCAGTSLGHMITPSLGACAVSRVHVCCVFDQFAPWNKDGRREGNWHQKWPLTFRSRLKAAYVIWTQGSSYSFILGMRMCVHVYRYVTSSVR